MDRKEEMTADDEAYLGLATLLERAADIIAGGGGPTAFSRFDAPADSGTHQQALALQARVRNRDALRAI